MSAFARVFLPSNRPSVRANQIIATTLVQVGWRTAKFNETDQILIFVSPTTVNSVAFACTTSLETPICIVWTDVSGSWQTPQHLMTRSCGCLRNRHTIIHVNCAGVLFLALQQIVITSSSTVESCELPEKKVDVIPGPTPQPPAGQSVLCNRISLECIWLSNAPLVFLPFASTPQ